MDQGLGEDEVVPEPAAAGSEAPTDGPPFPHLPPPPVVMPPPVAAEGLPPIAWVAIAVGLGLPVLLPVLGFVVWVVVLIIA